VKSLVGLRIDVDTFRGTARGVPELCRILARHNIHATFFFSFGPDNMGRHLWRLLKPAFLLKMLRSRAASLYGWDILLRGTFWPGPVIGKKLAQIIKDCADQGHEIGLHAWDHHAWQTHIENYSPEEIRSVFQCGIDLSNSLGLNLLCAAAPAWRCTDEVLRVKAKHFPEFTFNSDCRGEGVFLPHTFQETLPQPQVPVNLPTYDEVVGQQGVTAENYNEFLLAKLRPGSYNVLTIHAEVEGIVCSSLFDQFIRNARDSDFDFGPLSTLIPAQPEALPSARIERKTIPGREGWISVRSDE